VEFVRALIPQAFLLKLSILYGVMLSEAAVSTFKTPVVFKYFEQI